eukprot:CAMPEP_0174255190 /NCGR_PEP_ID=MMETSP0439-20130205/4533_1 /TAXON_ID=0 /ORGANISM="Stereomyxa ramosa, Strain Chinc5" /LENGTH=181 /DNA_ID=CAMNT_0015337259 /DNA_START=8 /DNA_END=553 /DNA_ORIENTATION=-
METSETEKEVIVIEEEEKVSLESRDGVVFTVPVGVARMLNTIKHMLDDLLDDDDDNLLSAPIPLLHVDAPTLSKILEYCRHYYEHPVEIGNTRRCECDELEDLDKQLGSLQLNSYTPLTAWDKQFFASIDQVSLFTLVLAANFLDMHHLLDVACKTIADQIKGKSPNEIRKLFGLENEYVV